MSLNSLFNSQNQQTMRQFYSDIVSSSIFNNQISYLSKYHQSELHDYTIVLCGQYLIKQIIAQTIKSNVGKFADLKQITRQQIEKLIQKEQNSSFSSNETQSISQQKIKMIVLSISQAVFSRLEEIKAQYILDTMSLGSLQLIDVNWKITKTISSEARSFIGQKLPLLFKLTIYLKSSQNNITDSSQIKTISLQLSKVQLKQLIEQLKSIRSEM